MLFSIRPSSPPFPLLKSEKKGGRVGKTALKMLPRFEMEHSNLTLRLTAVYSNLSRMYNKRSLFITRIHRRKQNTLKTMYSPPQKHIRPQGGGGYRCESGLHSVHAPPTPRPPKIKSCTPSVVLNAAKFGYSAHTFRPSPSPSTIRCVIPR